MATIINCFYGEFWEENLEYLSIYFDHTWEMEGEEHLDE